MKECPSCEFVNEEEADVCPKCGTAFFFTPECLQPPFNDPSDNLVVVGCYPDLGLAHLVASRLEDQNIMACVPEELASPNLTVACPISFSVCVPAKKVAQARNVMAELEL